MEREIKIRKIIYDICQKAGIKYKSKAHKQIRDFDARRLCEIYIQLKLIAAELQEIEDRHEVNGLGKLLKDDIAKILNIDHDLVKISKKLRDEK
jgi:hypothetical protein